MSPGRLFRAMVLLPAVTAALAAGCGIVPERSPGEKLWRKHCAECHGFDGAGNTPRYMGKHYADLVDDIWRQGSDDSALEQVIREGVFGEMPGFDSLSNQDIRLLIGYLRELRGEKIPEHPR